MNSTPIILPTCIAVEARDFREFVIFWGKLYDKSKDIGYDKHISSNNFTSDSLYDLFTWKNGMRLSQAKKNRVEKLCQQLVPLNQLRKHFDEALFTELFGEMTFVWKIFLKHILQPESFPIYDQHAHRAIDHLLGITGKKEDEDYYNGTFRYFIDEHRGALSNKVVDEGIFEFGKFIRNPRMKQLIETE